MKRIHSLELAYIQEVLHGSFRSSQGSRMMTRLENTFKEKFGMQYAIAHINGTATMHSILEAIGVGPGDEVIVPPLTMASTTFVVLQSGATPVFADVDFESFQIDPQSIAERITDKTKAIITVALYGLSPEMDTIMALAEKHKLFVLEDNAECYLGKYNGKIVGSLGHASSFSFQSSKHLTSGEGGIVLTNSEELAIKVRRISSLGYIAVGAKQGSITKHDIQDPNYSRHVSLGWNYRMPELCSAVALAQTERIEELVDQRIKVSKLFESVLEETGCTWLKPQKVGEGFVNSYWSWAVRLDRDDISWHRFRDTFTNNGGNGIYAAWKLTYLEPAFQSMSLLGREKFISPINRAMYKKGLCPMAEKLQPKILAFPNNYWDIEDAKKQSEILEKTIKMLSKG